MPPPPTYLDHLAAFTVFLSAYTHTLLYLRALYPRASFAQSRIYNTPVWQSRHPLVCEWIHDALSAVRDQLLAGTVARIGIVVFSYGGVGDDDDGDEEDDKGSPKIMERYMFDVSSFPVVERRDRNIGIQWEDGEEAKEGGRREGDGKGKQRKGLDADLEVDMSEQFRAAFVALTTRTSKLAPLPSNCSFNIAMELKDDPEADPPVAHADTWVAVQHSLQKTGRKGAHASDDEDSREYGTKTSEGADLGGVKHTPLRTVEAGVFRFETWIEEAKAKFDVVEKSQTTSD